MCQENPCTLSFTEAQKLISLGYKDRLIIDWYSAFDDLNKERPLYFYLTTGIAERNQKFALKIAERKLNNFSRGKCIFLNQDNLCRLHLKNLKPQEGKEACCNRLKPQEYKHLKNYIEEAKEKISKKTLIELEEKLEQADVFDLNKLHIQIMETWNNRTAQQFLNELYECNLQNKWLHS